MAARLTPELWPADKLNEERIRAIQVFVDRRLQEGDPDYLKHFTESESMIVELLSLTSDLTQLQPEKLLHRVDLIEGIARFTMGPPVSEDDLSTRLSLKRVHAGSHSEVASALELTRNLLDPTRFGWVFQGRKPTESERRTAIVATACIRAVERARTGLRISEQTRQEGRVASTLRDMKLAEVPMVRNPDKDMPEGSFKRDVRFESKQCDILIRLYENPQFLAIECKSSNSEVNSIKRLNDVFEKAEVWRRARGTKVVTAAVVAGAFSLKNLENAQGKGVYIFWEHDLKPLEEYVAGTKPPL